MKTIGLVTNQEYPKLCEDDRLLASELAASYAVDPVIWNDPKVKWADYDLLIMRSVWDYHLYPIEFRSWLAQRQREGVKVLNDLEIIGGNLHKSYLLNLQQSGLNVIRTEVIKRGSSRSLSELAEAQGLQEFVLKPAVSLSAHNTFYIRKHERSSYEKVFRKMVSEGDVMMQPFISQIQTAGELSLIFIDRTFSHAVRKRPKKNDFRVQSEFGGVAELIHPSPHLIQQVFPFIEQTKGSLLYARVDGVLIDEQFFLMELELIDPVLHFNKFPGSLKLMSDAVSRYLQQARENRYPIFVKGLA